MSEPVLGPRNRRLALPAIHPAHPRGGNLLTRTTGRLALRAAGWTFEGRLPHLSRMVVVVAPHTSAWDFLIGVAARASLGLRVRYFGKHTLFRPPLGWVMRWLGGIPVVRDRHRDVVAQAVERFGRGDALILALSPEGTRRKVERWRTGFWHIAHAARVPILPIGLDYGTRSIRIGVPVEAGDDLEATVAGLRSWFGGMRARYPELS